MIIKYNYRIMKVDEETKTMEVLYTPHRSDILKEYLVGAKLPHENQTLDDVIRSYAPLGLWQEDAFQYQYVDEGIEGEMAVIIGNGDE